MAASSTPASNQTAVPPSGTSSSVAPSAATAISSSISAFGPDDTIFTLQYINNNAWPTDFELNIDEGNWPTWLHQVALLADRQRFSEWLDGSLSCPDKTTHLKAHQI